jgi:hypothetical protein
VNSDIREICGRLLDGPAPPLRSTAEVVDLARRARRRRHGMFAATGAGLAVVAVAAAATAVPLVDGSGTSEEYGFGAAVATTAPVSPSGAASSTPSLDLGREVRKVPVSQVLTEMVPKAASVRPLTIPDGQLLYIRSDGREPPAGRVHEMWLDPQGMIPLRIDIDGADTSKGPKSNMEADIATARQVFAQEGPNLRMPTPQFLAGLPTDPAALLDMVTALNENTKLGGAYYVSNEIGQLLWEYGAVITPPVRVAFYHALSTVSRTATELTVDGRRLYALREPDTGRGFAEELLLDPSTGQAAGRRSLALGGQGQVTPTDLVLWRYAVVGTVGQRG